MNKFLEIFLFEFKRKSKSMIIWIILWTVFMAVTVAFYDTIAANAEELKNLLATMPKAFLDAFNIDEYSLSSIEGLINSRYTTFAIIIGGIWAGWQGSLLIGKDENTGALVWIVTQPVSRLSIYFSKVLTFVLWIFLANFVISMVTMILIPLVTSLDTPPHTFLWNLAISMSVYFIFLASFGNLISVIWNAEKGRTAAIFIVIFMYLMNIVKAFADAPDFVKYFTLNFYFDPDKMARSGQIQNEIYILLTAFLVLIIAGAILFRNRDIGKSE